MPLWGQGATDPPAQEWGPPTLKSARAEHARVVLSFTPVKEATSYIVRLRSAQGSTDTIKDVLVTDYSVQGLHDGTQYWFSVAAAGSSGTTAFSSELSCTPRAEMDWPSLAEAFSGSNPTRTSCPFWMVHGTETEDELRQFMQVIHKFGFEGVTLHPYDFKGFLEENNWKQWRVIVDAARKLGLTVWEQDDKDYPCGYAGGKVVAQNKELGRWEITLPHRESRKGPGALSLDVNAILPAKQRLVAVIAAGPRARFEDLTDRVASRHLHWDLPEGEWEIFVHGTWQPGVDAQAYPDFVRGEFRGYIDPLSESATDLYVQLVLEGTCRAIGYDEAGRTWKGFYIDEPGFYSSGTKLGEMGGGFPYTPDLLQRFEKRYGYSLRPYLPLLWVERGPETNHVRYDYMDFVSSEYARLFIGKQTRFSQAHGMQINGHVREDLPYQLGAGTGSNFRTLEAYSMAGFDHIFDQWYLPDEDVYWRQAKMASSISHYLETPLDEAMVEHYAATGWRTGLTEMKAMMDWTTCRGMSRIVPCGLDTQDPPVWEDAPEFWLHGKNPLAAYFHLYQAAANRETMMIRGGRHVAKAIVLDTAESAWVGGAEDQWRSLKALSQAHFDYDNVSYGVFSDPKRCRIEANRLRLGREDYEFVFLPGVDAIPIEVLRRLLEFYEAGGTVIILGEGLRMTFDPSFEKVELVAKLPLRSADGRHDDEVKDLVPRIWGDRASGRGHAHLISYKDIADFLYAADAHDVWIDPNLTLLQYYHRRLSGREVYFFNNEGEAVRTIVRLKSASGVPELWQPVSGKIGQAACYSHREGSISLRLDLARYESVFVVLNPSARPEVYLQASDADEAVRSDTGEIILRKYAPGTVQYTVARPDGKIEEKRLVTPSRPLSTLTLREGWSRTPLEPNGALYKCRFDWPRDWVPSAKLVVEGMTQIVEAKLNGKELGLRFAYPFSFELGGALRAGANELELRHVERYTFTSRLGNIKVVPYYEFRV
jgi:hypothetical protein